MRAWREDGCAGVGRAPRHGGPSGEGLRSCAGLGPGTASEDGGGMGGGAGAGESEMPLGSVGKERAWAVHGVTVWGGAPKGGEGSTTCRVRHLGIS